MVFEIKVIVHPTGTSIGLVEMEGITSYLERGTSICRIKFNSIPKAEKIITHGFHQDIYFDESLTEDGVKSAILYMNSNDGFTVFENGTKVKSIANRLVKFPSTLKHSGTTCTDCQRRVALNIVYF